MDMLQCGYRHSSTYTSNGRTCVIAQDFESPYQNYGQTGGQTGGQIAGHGSHAESTAMNNGQTVCQTKSQIIVQNTSQTTG